MSVVNQLKLPIVIQLCLSCQLEDVWEAAAIRSGGRGILAFFFFLPCGKWSLSGHTNQSVFDVYLDLSAI